MARAPATIPTITSPNASAATFRCRRITRTSPAKSTLVPFPDAECTRGVGVAGTISARIRKPAERATTSRASLPILAETFRHRVLAVALALPKTHKYVDRQTRAATAVHVRRHGPLDLRPGRGGYRDHDGRHFPRHQHPGRHRHLELLRAVPDRDAKSDRHDHRAGVHHDGQRDRAHRIGVAPGRGHQPALLPP